jgi:hypothetical protein
MVYASSSNEEFRVVLARPKLSTALRDGRDYQLTIEDYSSINNAPNEVENYL